MQKNLIPLVVGGAVSFTALELSGVLGFGLIIGISFIWYFTRLRGLLAVRAYIYLFELERGATTETANIRASQVDYREGANLAWLVKSHVQGNYGGRQLPMIAAARAAGFRG